MRRIIGITRFALVGNMGEGQFIFPHRKKPKGLTREAWVTSPGYLAHRYALLWAFAMPSILANMARVPEGYEYMHLIATNPNCPLRQQLKAALSPYLFPRVYVVDIEPSARLDEALQPCISSLVPLGDEYFTFRLDDDDALVGDYLDLVVREWPERQHGQSIQRRHVIAPAKGFYFGLDRHAGAAAGEEPLRMVPAVNPGSPHGIGAYNDNIHALGKHNAIPGTVPFLDRVYWLRTVHRSNVTLAGHGGTVWGGRGNDVIPEPLLERFFPHLDVEQITAALRQEPVV